MLFMVVERFRSSAASVGERFNEKGRMLPEGLTYQTSWMEVDGSRCFQIMETEKPELFEIWSPRWDDLIQFEIVPILTCAKFWAKR